jgi:hypothetical protein
VPADTYLLWWYLIPAFLTAFAFVAMETRRPWHALKPSYPWGLACLSWMVWAAAAVMGLTWPVFWLTGGPEMVRNQLRPATNTFAGVLNDETSNKEAFGPTYRRIK